MRLEHLLGIEIREVPKDICMKKTLHPLAKFGEILPSKE